MPQSKTVAKKPRTKPAPRITAGRIAKALRLLERHENCGRADPEAKTAMKFYNMAKKFFALNGRFKRNYTRKKKVAKK